MEMIRMGQVASSRSPILGDEENLPFWVDDRVRLKKPNPTPLPLKAIPGFEPNVRLVRDIYRCDQGFSYHVSDHLFGGWEEVSSSDNLELISRGNIWRLAHGEGTIFRDWREELDCHVLLGDVSRVESRAEADAFAMFIPDQPPYHAAAIRYYRFADRVIGDRIRLLALKVL